MLALFAVAGGLLVQVQERSGILPKAPALRAAPGPAARSSSWVASRPSDGGARMDGAKSAYLLQDLPAGRGSYLLYTWQQAAQMVRSNGFSPSSEAFGEGAARFKELSDALPRLASTAKILGLTANGGLNFDNLPEPHASSAEQLSRTKLVAALSAGQGSAVAFVSTWPDHVSIDACVVNPNYLALSQNAEAELIEYVVQEARAAGISDIRLHPSLQMDGEFYEGLGFRATLGEGAEAADTLSYQAPS